MHRAQWAAVALVATACQTYDFEPVEPLALSHSAESYRVTARSGAPNLMLVVDKSGSMEGAVGTSTRMKELKSAMAAFLPAHAGLGRYGLVTFPNSDTGCGTGGQLLRPIPSPADEVNASIQGLTSGGGTPTAAVLRALLDDPALNESGRTSVVLLLTDGMPNCNAQNPTPKDRCVCTAGNGCGAAGACASADAINCVDDTATVAAVTALAQRKVRTAVIGFGADTTTCAPATEVLDRMAQAGGLDRSCTGCSRYYPAQNSKELADALTKLIGIINPEPCKLPLSSPPDPSKIAGISVRVDGEEIAQGASTWSLKDAFIVFAPEGDVCKRLQESSTEHPVEVEVQVLELE